MDNCLVGKCTIVPIEIENVLNTLNLSSAHQYDADSLKELVLKYKSEREDQRTVITIDGTKESMVLVDVVCTKKTFAAIVNCPTGTNIDDVVIVPILLRFGNTVRVTTLRGYRD